MTDIDTLNKARESYYEIRSIQDRLECDHDALDEFGLYADVCGIRFNIPVPKCAIGRMIIAAKGICSEISTELTEELLNETKEN